MNMIRPGSRKFIVAMTALVIIQVCAAFKWIEGSEIVTALGLVVGLYGAGNVGEYMAERGQ
jgi:hypothetical protein